MDSSKKTREQHRLKGATRILADQHQVDNYEQLAKSSNVPDLNHPSHLDSTTSASNLHQFAHDNPNPDPNSNPTTISVPQISTSAIYAGRVFTSHSNNNSNNNNSSNDNTTATSNSLPIASSSVDTHSRSSSISSNALITTIAATPSPHVSSTTTASSSANSKCNLKGNIGQSASAIFTDEHLIANISPQISSCDIKSLFECPICFDYAVPPIYQCQNGHLVCQGCLSRITHCPTCRVPISEPSIRNLQLDRLAQTFQFPCKYNFNGCQWKSYSFKKRDHEDNCDYISYSCPCPGAACKWTGLINDVMPHLSEHHRSITTLSGEDIVFLATDINLKGAVDWVMIQSCFNRNFLLVLEKQEQKNGQQQFYAIVQLIGCQKETEKFKYRLELSSSLSGQIKKLQWESKPHSILEGIQSVIASHDCLVFDAKMAKHFLSQIQKDNDNSANGNNEHGENLGINVTISRLV